jgi:hypothetical protein
LFDLPSVLPQKSSGSFSQGNFASVQFGCEASRHQILVLFVAIATGAQREPVSSGSCPKNLRVDQFLLPEDAAAAKRAFEKFREALLKDNREQVIALMNFPADLVVNGRGLKIDSAHELVSKYDTIFTEYVIRSVRDQKTDELLGGWDGVSLSNEAVSFMRSENGEFRINNVIPKPRRVPDSIADFLAARRLCVPVVVEGRIVAYNWLTHMNFGLENIYIDHFIVDVVAVLRGAVPQKRIRVDFWGVSHLPEYNLPSKAFQPGIEWRMYLRPAEAAPVNSEVCRNDVQESLSFVDELGREVEKKPAIEVLAGKESPTYANLPCFEVNKQFFSPTILPPSNP